MTTGKGMHGTTDRLIVQFLIKLHRPDNISNDFPDDDDVTTSGVPLEEGNKRVIFLRLPQPQRYCNNHISTAKYR